MSKTNWIKTRAMITQYMFLEIFLAVAMVGFSQSKIISRRFLVELFMSLISEMLPRKI
jgi:lipid-A-disaccharide synthase-like uncharacterized protein